MSALLGVRGLTVDFSGAPNVVDRARRIDRPGLRAVDGVVLAVNRGASLGLVGESGCGKSTLALAIVGLERRASGAISFDGEELGLGGLRVLRRRMQLVFQDPFSSLNPSMTVGSMLGELVRFHLLVSRAQVRERCLALLGLVGLPEGLLDDVPSPMKPPSGCHFHTRCPIAQPRCAESAPVLREGAGGHFVACHLA